MKRSSKVYLVLGFLAAAIAHVAVAAPESALQGLSYSPSGLQSEAQLQAGVPEAVIRADLERLRTVTPRVRTYSVDRGLDRVPAVARTLGMKVSLGLWLGRDKTQNEIELEHGIKVLAAYSDVIDRVFVGNETLERQDLTAAELIAYISRVKSVTKRFNKDIGTAETWSIWLKHPELGTAVDFVGVHLLPYWDGVPEGEAVAYAKKRYGEIAVAFPNKKLVVAETGWPSAGETRQAAVPSPGAQADYVHTFLGEAARQHYDFYVVEAFDQPWKSVSRESSVGPYWGVFDAARTLKFSLPKRRAGGVDQPKTPQALNVAPKMFDR